MSVARAATTSDVFNAIAEPQRREILVLLRAGERPSNTSFLPGAPDHSIVLLGRSPARSSTRISRRCGSAIALKTSDVVAARATDTSYSDIGICQREDPAGLVR